MMKLSVLFFESGCLRRHLDACRRFFFGATLYKLISSIVKQVLILLTWQMLSSADREERHRMLSEGQKQQNE